MSFCINCGGSHTLLEPCPPKYEHPAYAINPGRDPWKHRSSGMKCDTCMWFVGKEPDRGVGTVGRCRRHAPTMSGYPTVFTTDWCGDHKLDENKVAR